MPNITISVPEYLYEEMKLRKEIKWSEVIRRAISEYLEKLKRKRIKGVTMEELREKFKDILDEIPLDIDVDVKELRKMELRRVENT